MRPTKFKLHLLEGGGWARHGICHGCTDIIRVEFLFAGVKYNCEHTLFVEN